jgi:hypothetical protein
MSHAGFSKRRVARQMGVHKYVTDRLLHRLQATRMVVERSRSCRPHSTTHRDDRLLGVPGEIVLLHQLVFEMN